MRKSYIAVGIVSLSLLGAGLMTGCASTSTQESTGQMVDSTAITGKVKTAFLKDKSIKSLDIKVKTYKNVVQLSGFVDNTYQKRRAEQIARSVEGVESVTNSLVIKSHTA